MWQAIIPLAALPAIAWCAFAHEDVQLFELRDKIIEDLGKDTDFYSWIGVKKGAKTNDIIKAFRKVSRRLHPDRNPGQEGTERFARLNQVYKILRSPVRDRYDYYLSRGFPTFDSASGEWKMKHFRPNLLFAALFVAAIVTFIHFLALKASAHRQRGFLDATAASAREAAARESSTGVVTSTVQVQHGQHVFTVHPTGDVYFEGSKVTSATVAEPTWHDTILGRLVARLSGQQEAAASVAEEAPVEPAQPAASEAAPETKPKKTETEILKKGAARRRPAAARGKAKIF